MGQVELPRCAACRTSITVGDEVVFRQDGRVQHTSCPKVVCPICSREVVPGTPIRRDGEALLHPACWSRRYRSEIRGSA
jgi:hypothetical protein